MSKTWPTVAIIGGILLALNGMVYTIGLVPTFGTSGPILVDAIGLFALGLIPLGLGLAGIWYGKRRLKQIKQTMTTQRRTRLEQSILRAANANPQGISLEEVVQQTCFDADDVKAAMEKMYLDSKLDMDVTEQGHLIYKPRAI